MLTWTYDCTLCRCRTHGDPLHLQHGKGLAVQGQDPRCWYDQKAAAECSHTCQIIVSCETDFTIVRIIYKTLRRASIVRVTMQRLACHNLLPQARQISFIESLTWRHEWLIPLQVRCNSFAISQHRPTKPAILCLYPVDIEEPPPPLLPVQPELSYGRHILIASHLRACNKDQQNSNNRYIHITVETHQQKAMKGVGVDSEETCFEPSFVRQ